MGRITSTPTTTPTPWSPRSTSRRRSAGGSTTTPPGGDSKRRSPRASSAGAAGRPSIGAEGEALPPRALAPRPGSGCSADDARLPELLGPPPALRGRVEALPHRGRVDLLGVPAWLHRGGCRPLGPRRLGADTA